MFGKLRPRLLLLALSMCGIFTWYVVTHQKGSNQSQSQSQNFQILEVNSGGEDKRLQLPIQANEKRIPVPVDKETFAALEVEKPRERPVLKQDSKLNSDVSVSPSPSLIAHLNLTENLKIVEKGVFEGSCTSEGQFADRSDCQKFHMCEVNEVGDILDNVILCPDDTVWCDRTENCEDSSVCSCPFA